MQPDPDEIRTMEDLRAALIRLAGPTRKQSSVARDIRKSNSTVSDVFAGRRGVTRTMVRAIVSAYGRPADLDRWEQAWRRVQPSRARPTVPRQLPFPVRTFVARGPELTRLDAVLGGSASAVRQVVVSGMGGIGKTELVLHWGHRHEADFPDGSLYVDLRGYSPQAPLEQSSALADLLRGLGVPDAEQPAGQRARIDLFRSRTATRRVLIVLDNARDVDQVEDLLPGSSLGMTVITSRSGLESLRYRRELVGIELDVLSIRESAQLMANLVGVRDEKEPLEAVAAGCGGLPLALRVIAGTAVDRPGGLATVLAELSDGDRLRDILSAGDARSTVRTVLSWSVSALEPATAETFYRLGTAPAMEFDTYTTAALAGNSLAEAANQLDALRRARLLKEPHPGRLTMHDLVRDCARSQGADIVDEATAADRLGSFYWHALERASRLFGPTTDDGPVGPLPELAPLDRSDAAVRWLAAERPGVLAFVAQAFEQERWSWVYRIADASWRVFMAGGFHADAVWLHQHAVEAARRDGRMERVVSALEHLGIAEQLLGRLKEAIAHLQEAVRLVGPEDHQAAVRTRSTLGAAYSRTGQFDQSIHWLQDAVTQARLINPDPDLRLARSQSNLGLVYQNRGRSEQAIELLDPAIATARAAGERHLLAIALNNRSLACRTLGRLDQARSDISESRDLARQIGDAMLLAQVLDSLGALLIDEDDPATAFQILNESLEMHRRAGEVAAVAETLDNVGAALRRLGRLEESLASHEEAVELAESVGDRDRLGQALLGCALTCIALERPRLARPLLQAALDAATETQNEDLELKAKDILGRL